MDVLHLIDIHDALRLSSRTFSTLASCVDAPSHLGAFGRLASATAMPGGDNSSSPYAFFQQDLRAIAGTVTAMLHSLAQPRAVIDAMARASAAVERHRAALRRSDRWPLGLLDGTRARLHQDAAQRVERAERELAALAGELRYVQQTVAGELAAWHELHEAMARRALRGLAQRMVVAERARLESMKRAVRGVLDIRSI
jgi:hypothetical protein